MLHLVVTASFAWADTFISIAWRHVASLFISSYPTLFLSGAARPDSISDEDRPRSLKRHFVADIWQVMIDVHAVS
jgi:hypothetical protein